ncbi:hypothetical protein WSS_A25085 [Rhodococcus opacus M213]|uniref:Transmembrane protein n=1 Tax=Rhodococcus opacus M213 TaxID=1129896 RepID=K8XS65_RHOOP|nr:MULTISPECIES: hypothetical protein [Rhodococcus]EKT79910.1 hypothetical protein WSS_A25085 [Rhodococcus opacus M213]RZI81638.1 MAG: hypothetical protein EOO67_18500 [Microbacterium sp.]GLK40726.1 hypothetical protein GCM10017611_76010 [Rhodococcus wratislaviensis]
MINNDDLLYRVDRHYLGPTGYALPVRIRYTAGLVGAAVFAAVFLIARAILHVPLGFKPLLVMVLVTVWATTRISKYVTPDQPLRSVLKAAANDLSAPRPPKPGVTVSVTLPDRLTTGSQPDDVTARTDGEDSHR